MGAMKFAMADALPRQQLEGPMVLYVKFVPAAPHPPAWLPPVPVAVSTWL